MASGEFKHDPGLRHLISFDPGGRTGWAHFIYREQAFSRPEHKVLANVVQYDHGELSGTEHAQMQEAQRMIRDTVVQVSYLFVDVVSEDFDLTQMIGGKELLSPVRLNAVLSWICQDIPVRFSLQSRQLRTGVTKERLRTFGFPGPFRKDEFAAMQHAVTWLRRTKKQSKSHPWKLSSRSTINDRWDCACTSGGKCDLAHPS